MTKKEKFIPVLGISNDVPMLRSFVREFKHHGYGIFHAVDPDAVEKVIDKFNPQLVILEEGVDGHFPEDFEDQKVISILKEGSTPDHRADVMELGVENYVIKPVVPSHLRWIVQKADPNRLIRFRNQEHILEMAGLSINLDKRSTIYNGQEIHLAESEFILLYTFLKSGDRVVLRKELEDLFSNGKRVSGLLGAKTHMTFVRKRLEESGVTLRFKNYRAVGWKLEVGEEPLSEKEE